MQGSAELQLHVDEVGFDVGQHVCDKVRMYASDEVDLYVSVEI